MKKILLISVIFVFCAFSLAQAQTVTKSTIDDQIGVEVTVYNSNVGLVKDTRKVNLSTGKENELQFMDVAASIMPVTVHAKSLNAPDKFMVLEQNYEYDLMNSTKLLDKFVGKKIKLMENNQYQDRKSIVEATLLSNNNGQIYKVGDEIYLGYPGYQVLPKIPENLIAKPTLTWMYASSVRAHDLQVSYLTNQINWKADYVLILDKADVKADLSGWVTIDNKSGTAYNNAKLKLVAGDVNRVQQNQGRGMRYKNEALMMDSIMEAPQFQEQAFFEYHIYDLQRQTDIKDNQTKQISLLEANGFNITKEFLVYGEQGYYTRQYREEIPKQKAKVFVKFKNEEKNNLGLPLPAGIMRLYKQDDKGSLQFIGEDRIDHMPKDEEVKIKVGEAFDVVVERKQIDYKQITRTLYETEWEITVRNHKKEEITVGLIEPLYGNWTMLSSSHQYEKIGAFTARFDVRVPKDGEVTVKYRIRVGI
ncbi:MAG: DUF4139 domain-containing protein [Candidatus Omnitrophica bacterium]|nr:DUF4139 domain-containing protein [Candidatus Omnitrophota bacterium]